MRFLICVLLLLHLFSCTSPSRIVYFQDLNTRQKDSIFSAATHTIQPNDILQLTVSSNNPEADRPFQETQFSFQLSTTGNSPASGYLVDSLGEIDLPYIGTTTVKGLSTLALKTQLKEKLSPFLKDPAVNVRLVNFKVSILGEVGRPGTYTLPVERVTLPEALSMAGDITINGKREDVLIIRETNGVREYQHLDMKKTDWFSSPFYYLRAHDVVYIQPSKTKVAQADVPRFQLITVITSILSLGAIIITSVNR